MPLSFSNVRRAGAAALALLIGGGISSAPADAVPRHAYLSMRINQGASKDVLVSFDGEQVLIHAAELRAAGINIPADALVQDGAEDFVVVARLPGAQAHVDEVALTVDLSLPANVFGSHTLSGDSRLDAASVARFGRGAFFNYGLTARDSAPLSLSGQLGLRLGAGILESNLAQTPSNRGYALAQTAFTVDDVEHARRSVVGTTYVDVSDAGGLGGVVGLAGVSVRRQLALNPNLVRFTTGSVGGVALTQSVVDVYVNNQLVRQEYVDPGAFQITNLPSNLGANRTSVVIRDALGNEQTVNARDYNALDLLPAGAHEYDFGIGRQVGGASDALVAGRYVVGASRHATLGVRAVTSAGLTNGAFMAGLTMPLGEVTAVIARSAARATANQGLTIVSVQPDQAPVGGTPQSASGAAEFVQFSHEAPRSSFAVSYLRESPWYASPAIAIKSDRLVRDAHLSARASVGRSVRQTTFTLDVHNGMTRDSGARTSAQFGVERQLGRDATFGISAGSTTAFGLRSGTFSVFASAVVAGRNRVSLDSSAQDGAVARTVEVASSNSSELGTAYDARMTEGVDGGASVRWERRARNGGLLLDAYATAGAQHWDATLSGAVALVGHDVFLARPITGAFGVVDIAGVGGVPVIVNGQQVGETNQRGKLFVPNLSSSSINDVRLDVDRLPDGVDFPAVEQRFVGRLRMPSVIAFDARRIHAYVGTLRLSGAAETPAFGVASIEASGGHWESEVGEGGRFYFETLPAGAYRMQVRYPGGSCHVERFVVAPGRAAVTDLGQFICEKDPA